MKYLVLFLLFFLSADCFSQKKGVFKSDVVVDGNLTEWGEKLDHYDKDNMLWYSVANDDDFLYLAILKDKHVIKMYHSFEVFISEKKVTDKSPSLIYLINLPISKGATIDWLKVDALNKQSILSWDFLVLKNWGDSKQDTLSVFNELGIQAQGKIIRDQQTEEELRKYNRESYTMDATGGIKNRPYKYAASKGRTAYFEFAIPLKQLKVKAEGLNMKIRLKGNSENVPIYYNRMIMSDESYIGEARDEELDKITATEHTFTYKLTKK